MFHLSVIYNFFMFTAGLFRLFAIYNNIGSLREVDDKALMLSICHLSVLYNFFEDCLDYLPYITLADFEN